MARRRRYLRRARQKLEHRPQNSQSSAQPVPAAYVDEVYCAARPQWKLTRATSRRGTAAYFTISPRTPYSLCVAHLRALYAPTQVP